MKVAGGGSSRSTRVKAAKIIRKGIPTPVMKKRPSPVKVAKALKSKPGLAKAAKKAVRGYRSR